MKKFVLSGILMCIICAAYAEIYKWTDDQGVVHFSDHSHPGSEKVKIPEAQVYTPPPIQKTEIPPIDNHRHNNENPYTSVTITQPLDQSTIRNNDGSVAVAVQVLPNLLKGNNLQIIFDGSPAGDPQSNSLFQLNGLYRGKHTIAVQILDENGEVIMKSESVTIFMFRPRVGMVK